MSGQEAPAREDRRRAKRAGYTLAVMGPMDPGEISRREYVARINRVLDYVRDHLDGDLSLRTLARVANFSPYHFHRGFRAMVGEPIGAFIRRLRVLTAASMLSSDPIHPVTHVARESEFSSSS